MAIDKNITQLQVQYVERQNPPDTSGLIYTKAPVVIVPDESNGFSGVTVPVEHPDNAFEEGDSYSVPYGAEPPAGGERDTETITFSSRRVTTKTHNLLVGPNNLPHRRAQLQNMGPHLLAQLERQKEKAYLSALAAYSATSLTGGSGKLVDMAEADNIWALMFDAIGDAGLYDRRDNNVRLIGAITDLDLLVLARYEELSGVTESGYGAERRNAGIAGNIESFAARLAAQLMLDEVRIARSVLNTASARDKTVTRGRTLAGKLAVFPESNPGTYNATAGNVPQFGNCIVTADSAGPVSRLYITEMNQKTRAQELWAESFFAVQKAEGVASYSADVPTGICFSDIR